MKRLLHLLATLLLGAYEAGAQVQINEIMASNTRSVPDIVDFEDYPDWFELKNTTNSVVSLDGYFISDDPSNPFKWAVPSGASIPANGYLMFIADGHDAAPGQSAPRGYWPWKNFTVEKYHTNFSLSALGETLTLTKATGLSSTTLVNASTSAPAAVWKYKDNGSDQSTQWRASNFDDSSWASGPARLGYGDPENTIVSYGPNSGNKYITTYFRHHFNVTDPTAYTGLTMNLLVDDGCVVYLNGNEVVRRNMSAGDVNYTTLASVTVGGADETTFFAYTIPATALVAGDNVLAVEVHQAAVTSSDISFDLGLNATLHTSYATADSVTWGQQVSDISYGRDNANPNIWRQFAEPTPGAANTTAVVNDIRVTGNSVTISLPGGLYVGNQNVTMSVPSGEIRYTLDGSNPKSNSSLYSAPLTISNTTVLRARCFEAGKSPGAIVTRTYLYGETITNVPLISVVADPNTLFGNTIGIYANQHESVTGGYGLNDVYKEKDAPGNVEFFATGGAAGFNANCGIRIGSENNWPHPQKALNIFIRSEYGSSPITYDLFPGNQTSSHTSFTLRDGGDNWEREMLRDGLWPKLCKGILKADTSDYRPSIVFINGAYYGIHNIRERWDATWFLEYHHIASDSVDHLIYGHVTSPSITLGAQQGDTTDWVTLMTFMSTADLTVQANWDYVESKIDMDSFMDFIIAESYGNNTSWPWNREFWRDRNPGGKWHWFLPDMDRTWDTGALSGILSQLLGSEDALVRLKVNTGFKQRLAQRFAAHAAGTFAPARVIATISAMDTEVAAFAARHEARWAPYGMTASGRAANIQNVKDYANARATNIHDEVSSQLGVPAAVNLTLAVNNAAGGSFLVQGVPVAASTFKIFPNIPFTLQAVPAPGYAFSSWTGVAGTGSSLSVTVNSAATITANFVPSNETVIGGTLTSNTTFTTANANYSLSSDLIVPAGVTLTIQPGVTIYMPPQRNIRVQGVLNIAGTAAQPVTITGRNGERWGGISLEDGSGLSTLAHLIIRGATRGYNPVVYNAALTGHNATLVADFIDIAGSDRTFHMVGASFTVRDSTFYSPYIGDGILAEKCAATIQRCTFPGNSQRDTDAIDFNGVTNGLIEDCKIYRFSGFNSDGIDLGDGSSNVLIQGNLIYFNADKGVSVGQGSKCTMRKNLIVGCYYGVGIKDLGSAVTIDQNTFVSCDTGVGIYEKNFGRGGGSAVMTNTIISKATVLPVEVDSFSTLSTSYSLSDTVALTGSTNLLTDPLFVDPNVYNFQLQPTSPAINAGDPAHSLDADGSRVDIGAEYAYSPADYPYTIGETVVINEILANSGAASDWIELYNRTNAPINIGGWFLSDDGTNLLKYRIPVGTVIPAHGYQVFYEDVNFGSASIDPNKIVPFALSDTGESVYLSSAANDQLTDYQSKEDFGPSTEGETVGFYYKPSTDSYNFVPLKTPTPGAPNSGPRIGPIVISEIMYNPGGTGTGDAEYLELLNVINAPVTLYDTIKGKAWKFSDGIDYEFPSATPLTMAPGERIVLTKNLALFNTVYGSLVPAGTKVFQWTTGSLSNSGETVQLVRPGAVDALNVQQYVRVDKVVFSDSAPWPTSPDGHGPSLTKISEKDYGNDHINWMAATASPGAIAPGNRFAIWAASYGVSGAAADPDGDGVPNLLEYARGTNPLVREASVSPALSLDSVQNSVSYDINSINADVDYLLEASPDLQQWSAVDAAPFYLNGNTQTRTYQIPPSQTAKMFYRLRLIMKP